MTDQARYRGNGESFPPGSQRSELAARLKAICQLTDELFGGRCALRIESVRAEVPPVPPPHGPGGGVRVEYSRSRLLRCRRT